MKGLILMWCFLGKVETCKIITNPNKSIPVMMFSSIMSSHASQRKNAQLSLNSKSDSTTGTTVAREQNSTAMVHHHLSLDTAGLSTAHDAVLAELHGQRGIITEPDGPVSSKLHALPNADVSSAALLRSAASSPVSENVFDPFTGAAVGIMSPPYQS